MACALPAQLCVGHGLLQQRPDGLREFHGRHACVRFDLRSNEPQVLPESKGSVTLRSDRHMVRYSCFMSKRAFSNAAILPQRSDVSVSMVACGNSPSTVIWIECMSSTYRTTTPTTLILTTLHSSFTSGICSCRIGGRNKRSTRSRFGRTPNSCVNCSICSCHSSFQQTMLRTGWRGLAKFDNRRQSGYRFHANGGILPW